MNKQIKNLTGMEFTRLTVDKLSDKRTKQGRICWDCTCKCGNKITVIGSLLVNKDTKSCGCLDREKSSQRFKDNNPVRKLAPGESAFRSVVRWYKRDALKRGYAFELTLDQARSLMQSKCYYCGIASSMTSGLDRDNGKFTRNGIDRLDNTKGYTPDNTVSCCFICNKAKWTSTVEEFKSWINKVHNNLFNPPREVTPGLASWIINQ